MIEQLKLILKDALIDPAIKDPFDQNVITYETVDKQLLHVNRNVLSTEQVQLLDIFLKPVKLDFRNQLSDQIFWSNLLFGTGEVDFNDCRQADNYRLIHFYIQGNIQNNSDFIEALENLFQNVSVIWASEHTGVIVEYIQTEEEVQNYENTIETIMADFYIKISLFSGSYFSNIDFAKDIYKWEKEVFDLGRHYLPNLSFIQKEDLIPYLFISQTPQMTKNMLLSIITTQEDEEMLKTIKVFLECNLNMTLAAKKLYIHRNSLQYRIDKFIEKTGIDIKQFHHAASMYMLILLGEVAEKEKD